MRGVAVLGEHDEEVVLAVRELAGIALPSRDSAADHMPDVILFRPAAIMQRARMRLRWA